MRPILDTELTLIFAFFGKLDQIAIYLYFNISLSAQYFYLFS